MTLSNLKEKIGFMLGRFSPIEKGRIQAFPWQTWCDEFACAKKYGFGLMEWVIEQDRLDENPLMNVAGRRKIGRLKDEFAVEVPSITCDTFIQKPFYKAQGHLKTRLLEDFKKITEACCELGISKIVVPLVDKGSPEKAQEKEDLVRGMDEAVLLLKDGGAMIVFESDLSPQLLKDFIGKFDPEYFGINYDIGNSASLGYDHKEELAFYGNRIKNVHIKDRKFKGATVPLGEGDADIPGVLHALYSIGYDGNYILQTARALDGDHAGALCRYRDVIAGWFNKIEDGAYGQQK